MLIKIIIVIAIIALVLSMLKRVLKRPQASAERRAIESKTARCERCGVYFPREEATVRKGKASCSAAHADAKAGG